MNSILIQENIPCIQSIQDLKDYIPTSDNEVVFIKGFRNGSTDGSGYFEWFSTNIENEVPGIIVSINSQSNGRFKRIINQHRVNVLDCGAFCDGINETHEALKVALNYAIANNLPCYAPRGVYLLGGRVDPILGMNSNLILEGDGIDFTIFKEKDGLTLLLGRYNMSLYFNVSNNLTVNSIICRDFTIDKNGHTSLASTAGSYEYEQAHALTIASGWTNSRIRYVEITSVKTKDKIGAGICLSQGIMEKVIINRIIGSDYQHNGGQRGDFEFQSVVIDLTVNDSSGLYIQCEPNIATPPNSEICKAKFSNSNYRITELTAYSASPYSQIVEFSNYDAMDKMTIRYAQILAKNSRFRVGSGQDEYWDATAKGSILENCEIVVRVNSSNNTFSSFYPRSNANYPTYLKVKESKFTADSLANSTTTGFAINNIAAYSGQQEFLVEIENTEFDSKFEKTINCYGNGNYILKECNLTSRVGSSGAIQIGGYSTYFSNVILENNDLKKINSPLIQFTTSNTLWSCSFKGVHDFAKCNFTASNLGQVETCIINQGVFSSDAVPTGKGIKGWVVKINKPEFGYGSEFFASSSSASSSQYFLRSQNGIKFDISANRPTSLTLASRGLKFIDTTLNVNGKLIVFNGSNWIDSNGSPVV